MLGVLRVRSGRLGLDWWINGLSDWWFEHDRKVRCGVSVDRGPARKRAAVKKFGTFSNRD